MTAPLRTGLVLCMLCAPGVAGADVTLTGHSTVTSFGMPVVGQETLRVRDTKIRRDIIDRGKSTSFLYDVNSREVTVLDNSFRQAEVHAMAGLAQATQASVSQQDLKLELKPTGRTQALKNWKCAEHTLSLQLPAVLGTEKVTLAASGQVWLTTDAAEEKALAPFVKAARQPDFFIGIPAFAKASPDQARAISEIIRRLASLGFLCSADVDLRYEGSGPMANLGRKLASKLALQYESMSTEDLKDEVFAIPQGYRVIRR